MNINSYTFILPAINNIIDFNLSVIVSQNLHPVALLETVPLSRVLKSTKNLLHLRQNLWIWDFMPWALKYVISIGNCFKKINDC